MRKIQLKLDYGPKDYKPHTRVKKHRSVLWFWLLIFPLLVVLFSIPIWYFLDLIQKENTEVVSKESTSPNKVDLVQSSKSKELSTKIKPKKVQEKVKTTGSSTITLIPDSKKQEPKQSKAHTPLSKQEPTQKNNKILPSNEESKDISKKDKSLSIAVNTNKIDPSQKNAFNDTDKANINNKKIDVCRLPQEAHTDKTKDKKLSFKAWLNQFKKDALDKGISEDVLKVAFQGVYPIKKVIKLDRRQSEYSMTFSKYLRNSISSKRISTGKQMLKKYHKTLKKLESDYGVQPQFIVAFWAMESNFGSNMGNFPTISTLATLAHEGRRSDFFYGELLCALQIIEDEHIPPKQMKSSWAGAMGQPQFMPSTFYHYAVDGNADGKLNIWKNPADVFASAANYLSSVGWKPKQSWGMEVKLPKNFDPYHAKFSEEKTIKEWAALGVTTSKGQKLPVAKKLNGSIILPSGIKGPAFLVFNNFRIIRKWNRSINYALAVAHLSDRLIGRRGLIAKAPKGEQALSRKNAIVLQSNLKTLGFYNDNIDGMIGLKTRDAIREYQKNRAVPADAYPSLALIKLTQKDLIAAKKSGISK